MKIKRIITTALFFVMAAMCTCAVSAAEPTSVKASYYKNIVKVDAKFNGKVENCDIQISTSPAFDATNAETIVLTSSQYENIISQTKEGCKVNTIVGDGVKYQSYSVGNVGVAGTYWDSVGNAVSGAMVSSFTNSSTQVIFMVQTHKSIKGKTLYVEVKDAAVENWGKPVSASNRGHAFPNSTKQIGRVSVSAGSSSSISMGYSYSSGFSESQNIRVAAGSSSGTALSSNSTYHSEGFGNSMDPLSVKTSGTTFRAYIIKRSGRFMPEVSAKCSCETYGGIKFENEYKMTGKSLGYTPEELRDDTGETVTGSATSKKKTKKKSKKKTKKNSKSKKSGKKNKNKKSSSGGGSYAGGTYSNSGGSPAPAVTIGNGNEATKGKYAFKAKQAEAKQIGTTKKIDKKNYRQTQAVSNTTKTLQKAAKSSNSNTNKSKAKQMREITDAMNKVNKMLQN